jgi:hypothetical protein
MNLLLGSHGNGCGLCADSDGIGEGSYALGTRGFRDILPRLTRSHCVRYAKLRGSLPLGSSSHRPVSKDLIHDGVSFRRWRFF